MSNPLLIKTIIKHKIDQRDTNRLKFIINSFIYVLDSLLLLLSDISPKYLYVVCKLVLSKEKLKRLELQ